MSSSKAMATNKRDDGRPPSSLADIRCHDDDDDDDAPHLLRRDEDPHVDPPPRPYNASGDSSIFGVSDNVRRVREIVMMRDRQWRLRQQVRRTLGGRWIIHHCRRHRRRHR